MWSDRLPPNRRRRSAERLLAILRPPQTTGPRQSRSLRFSGDPGPAEVARALRRLPGMIWLDGGATRHRLYANPLVTLAAQGGRARVAGGAGRRRVSCRVPLGAFDLLAAAFDAWGDPGGGLHLAGYLAYELGGELEDLPPPPAADFDLPDLYLPLYDQCLRFDEAGWRLEWSPGWRETPFDLAAAAQAELERPGTGAARGRPLPVPLAGPPASVPDADGFRTAVSRGVDWIGQGDLFQVNLCRRLESPLPLPDPWDLYLRLRAFSPADHGAYLQLGPRRAVLSISPETFLTVRGGEVESHPIKGTRARGADPAADAAAVRQLLGSEKERAELTMIVDVTRNDLGRVCVTGSVEVPIHGELMTLPTVHHTVSRVRGRLLPGVGPVELLRATFPPASITGAPKIRAMRRIAEAEPRRRGPAMGAIGWIGLDGDLDLSVSIRTAVAAGGRIAYHAGCGIVADSEPEAELAESSAKARAFLAALGSPEAD